VPFQQAIKRLVAGTARLGDDTGHVLDLSLGAAEGAQLSRVSIYPAESPGKTFTFFLASLRARLSLLLRSSSMMRRS